MAEYAYTGRANLEAMAQAKRYNRFLERLVIGGLAVGRVADFGAGGGQFAEALRGRGFDLLCVEPDPDLGADLRRRGFPCVATLDAVPAESLDGVYSLNVLEHIADDRGTLAAIARCLAPGGRLVLYVPAFACLYSSMDARIGHLRRYRRRELVEAVESANLEVEYARYADVLGFFAALVFKWIGGRDGRLSPGSVVLYDRLVFPLSRALDRLRPPFGKNVYVIARKR